MAIKLAFGIALAPAWDLPTLVAKARIMGWAGIEIPLAPDDANPLLADAPALRKTLADAGLAVAALATLIRLDDKPAHVLDRGRRAIDLAAAAGATNLRVLGWQVARGESQDTAIARIGARLVQLAEAGASSGVSIVVQNGGSFLTAKDLWLVCEVANHPGAKACWDLVAGMKAGEGPLLSVPTLNTRIGYARLWDAKSDAWDKPVPLGTGDAKCKPFVDRLRGIGFDDWLTYAPPTPAAADAAGRPRRRRPTAPRLDRPARTRSRRQARPAQG